MIWDRSGVGRWRDIGGRGWGTGILVSVEGLVGRFELWIGLLGWSCVWMWILR